MNKSGTNLEQITYTNKTVNKHKCSNFPFVSNGGGKRDGAAGGVVVAAVLSIFYVLMAPCYCGVAGKRSNAGTDDLRFSK